MKPFAKLAVALVFCGSPLPLLAQPVTQPNHPIGDVSAFHGAPDTLTRVIAHVEQTQPGRVIEIRFDDSSGTPQFDVALAQHGQVTFLQLQRDEGGLTPIADTSQATWMMGWRKMDATRMSAHASVDLSTAIQTAEQAANGEPAVAAGMARGADPTSDVHAYNVLLLRPDGNTHRVAVDSDTGEVIANPSALETWP